jgi:hypothetical protein
MIATISILIGAVLGTRYKVLCLVPTTLAGTAALAALDQLSGASLASTTLTALALAVGLQIGYVVGVIVRSVLLAALASNICRPVRSRGQPARIS